MRLSSQMTGVCFVALRPSLCAVIQSRRSPGGGWVAGGAEHGEGSPRLPMPAADEDGGFLIALHRSRPLHHTRGSADSE